MKSDSEI